MAVVVGDLGVCGEVVVVVVVVEGLVVAAVVVVVGLRWRGTSLPSEKSWSAGSMVEVVGLRFRGNSKSGSGEGSQGGWSRKVSGETPMLLTQAEAIV